ncbi:hypothetical protein B0H14DRAFT_2570437 [Mycena olivaceomarginata]|nr:hypothetical protein B0H14DRAFT_2570437 [Mycena olivaceomarginata]
MASNSMPLAQFQTHSDRAGERFPSKWPIQNYFPFFHRAQESNQTPEVGLALLGEVVVGWQIANRADGGMAAKSYDLGYQSEITSTHRSTEKGQPRHSKGDQKSPFVEQQARRGDTIIDVYSIDLYESGDRCTAMILVLK